MTLRGVPCLFYGTEQSLHCDIEGGADPYNRPMMETWDSSHPNYSLIQVLSNLRKVNPALAMGSYEERYITEDIYVYTRHYRGNHVLVCINKSTDKIFDIDNTGLPDGELQCLLNQKNISIINGQIKNLYLEENTAHVFSIIDKPVSGKVVGVFELNGFETKPGETVCITGSGDELGNWDTTRAYGMEYVNENTWIAEVGFEQNAGEKIRFKFLVMHNGNVQTIENILPRIMQLPDKDRINIESIWSQAN
jgi:cyclomaltodextrin glucanotransferase